MVPTIQLLSYCMIDDLITPKLGKGGNTLALKTKQYLNCCSNLLSVWYDFLDFVLDD